MATLRHLDVPPDALLGHGGEAWVYALDRDRVVRVLHDGGRREDLERRQALVEELARSRPDFQLPELLEIGAYGARIFGVERRLRGRSLLAELETAAGARGRRRPRAPSLVPLGAAGQPVRCR
ncbi:MAG: hypothetical protein WAM30_02510 [Candidatus Dormiibacterota bacterium]